MIRLLRKYMLKIVESIDAGASDITEEEALELAKTLKTISDRDRRMSKYEACGYLNVSRATFDNYVRAGKLPKGKRQAGFKELSWSRREIDLYMDKYKGRQ